MKQYILAIKQPDNYCGGIAWYKEVEKEDDIWEWINDELKSGAFVLNRIDSQLSTEEKERAENLQYKVVGLSKYGDTPVLEPVKLIKSNLKYNNGKVFQFGVWS